MSEIVKIISDNGIAICCVAYLIYFQLTTMKEMLKTLNAMESRLSVIEHHIGCDSKDE